MICSHYDLVPELLFDEPVLTIHTNNQLVSGTKYPNSWSALVLLSMIIFVASYATGLGNVPWQQGELFGLEGGCGNP